MQNELLCLLPLLCSLNLGESRMVADEVLPATSRTEWEARLAYLIYVVENETTSRVLTHIHLRKGSKPESTAEEISDMDAEASDEELDIMVSWKCTCHSEDLSANAALFFSISKRTAILGIKNGSLGVWVRVRILPPSPVVKACGCIPISGFTNPPIFVQFALHIFWKLFLPLSTNEMQDTGSCSALYNNYCWREQIFVLGCIRCTNDGFACVYVICTMNDTYVYNQRVCFMLERGWKCQTPERGSFYVLVRSRILSCTSNGTLVKRIGLKHRGVDTVASRRCHQPDMPFWCGCPFSPTLGRERARGGQLPLPQTEDIFIARRGSLPIMSSPLWNGTMLRFAARIHFLCGDDGFFGVQDIFIQLEPESEVEIWCLSQKLVAGQHA